MRCETISAPPEDILPVLQCLFETQLRASRERQAPDRGERQLHLRALEQMLRKHASVFADLIAQDFGGRSQAEFVLGELSPVLAAIKLARRRLQAWMRPQRHVAPLMFQPGSAWVQHQPLGCVGIISPWNYPLLLSLSPLVDALAAGNRVMLKPSELTPRFSARLADALAEIFEPDRVAVAQGGAEVARAFASLPFDHLLFTGSTARGRDVMRAAAEHLTPLTLELGGKSPALICDDYDLAGAAERIAAGKFFNAGQTCLAPDYVLVKAERAEEFAALMAEQAGKPQSCGAAIISDNHLHRLQSWLDEVEAKGAKVIRSASPAGSPLGPPQGPLSGPRGLGPAVVVNPDLDCALMREEIFGPILPVIGVADLDAAIAFVNARPRPLALYPFTNSRAVVNDILARTLSGGVTWNGALLHCAIPALPFGGVGQSGFGAYHGEAGFRRFSHARAVYRAGWFSGFAAVIPPHTAMRRRMLNAVLRLSGGFGARRG